MVYKAPDKHQCPECNSLHWTDLEKEIHHEHYNYCMECHKICFEDYMVLDNIWALTGLEPLGGILHLLCVEKRIDRRLNVNDFDLSIPVNSVILFALRMTN